MIPLVEVYLKKPEQITRENISTHMFIAALFTIPKCPSVDEWKKQLWDIYTTEYYLVVKVKKILPYVTVWMDLENIMLSEISQSEKDKYHMISLICRI